MRHSTGKPTASQRQRLNALSKMTCIACLLGGVGQPNRTEVHHLVDKGTRKASGGHDATIPLCCWHHRGICIRHMNTLVMRHVYGPSLALHRRTFTTRYGTQRELLARVDKMLVVGVAVPAREVELIDVGRPIIVQMEEQP